MAAASQKVKRLNFSDIKHRVLGPDPELRHPEYTVLGFLDHQYGVLVDEIGYLCTLWEIPVTENETEKKFLVEHISAYVADKECSVLVPFHKIRDRVLEVAPETSLTGKMDGDTLSCLLHLKSFIVDRNGCFFP